MAVDIDFKALSLKDALDLAILVEEEAQERYEEFVRQMEIHHTPDSAVFFRFMAANEAKHGRELAERRQTLFGDAPRAVDRSMIYDVEAPGFEQARAFMSVRDALDLAYAAESKAWVFFDRAIPELKDPGVRGLFEELRQEEVEHQDLVKAELAKLPADQRTGLDPDDFVDAPTAQ
jgi:rubrerythrin